MLMITILTVICFIVYSVDPKHRKVSVWGLVIGTVLATWAVIVLLGIWFEEFAHQRRAMRTLVDAADTNDSDLCIDLAIGR